MSGSSGPAAELQTLGVGGGGRTNTGVRLRTAERRATLEPPQPGVTRTTTQGGEPVGPTGHFH